MKTTLVFVIVAVSLVTGAPRKAAKQDADSASIVFYRLPFYIGAPKEYTLVPGECVELPQIPAEGGNLPTPWGSIKPQPGYCFSLYFGGGCHRAWFPLYAQYKHDSENVNNLFNDFFLGNFASVEVEEGECTFGPRE